MKKRLLQIFLLLVSPFLFINQVKAEDIEEDENFIVVTKVFKGLHDGDIKKVSDDFKITVSNGTNNYNLTHNDSYFVEEKTTDGVTTWKWKLTGVEAGSYNVQEYNYEIENYEVSTSGTGANVTVEAASIEIEVKLETTCSKTNWPLEWGTFFASAMTGQGGKGTILLSEKPVNASQRLAIEKAILGGNWKGPVFYYSLEEYFDELRNLGEDEYLYVQGGKGFRYDFEKNEVILKDTSNWTQVVSTTIKNYDPYNPDITITNDYTYNLTDLNVIKEWSDKENADSIRPNEITVSLYADGNLVNYNGSDTTIIKESDGWKYTFTGLKKNNNGTPITYTIEESPVSGYIIDSENGYKVSQENGIYTITITNTHVVEETTVTVTKVWKNVDYFLESVGKLPKIKLVLQSRKDSNSEWTTISNVTLSKTGTKWTYTWGNAEGTDEKIFLPKSHEYRVKEIGYDGTNEEIAFYNNSFTTKTENLNNNSWKITNTCLVTYELPETGSAGGLILKIVGSLLLIVPVIYIGYILIHKEKVRG